MARKKNRTASKMFPLMAEYKSSGVGQKIFCKEKGIAYSVFQYWLTKYNDTQKPIASQPSPTFKEVKVKPVQSERMIVVRYRSGTEIHIPV